MKRRVLLAVLAVACAAVAATPGAASAGTLDQQQTESDGFFEVSMGISVAQSFTAALSGGLDQVDLKLSADGNPPTAPLTVEIRNHAAGAPGTAVLASANLPASAVGTTVAFVAVPFTAPAPVTAGTQYDIVTYSTTPFPNRYIWSKKGANPYPGGVAFKNFNTPPDTSWATLAGEDMAFKTYVAVPTTGPTGFPTTGPTGFCGGQPATKVGTEGPDVIAGSSGVDVIAGLGGNDRISGLSGKDILCGGDGNDKLKGGGGNDKLLGGSGKDTLKGGPGKDKLKGGPGKDKQIQ